MATNGTTGHETEAINVQDLKAALQKLKTDKVDPKVDKTTKVNGHALSGDVTVSKSDVGLGNVTNDAQVKRSEMGAASGVATLDSAGKVPSSQLPSYVDDVLEYDTKSAFPETGEGGKIYVDKSANTSWRWSGTTYTQIKGDLTIGTTSGTAADGKVVNDHINNTSNPHGVTKTQVGLGDVVNTGDSATPVSGGTTKFTTGGAYTELNKKVDKVTGKGLSTNDYTDNEKDKLGGIEAGAQKHIAPTAAEVKSALGTGSGTTKYLREDGTWQTPEGGDMTNVAYLEDASQEATVAGFDPQADTVHVTAQSLTSAQKVQARTNIDAIDSTWVQSQGYLTQHQDISGLESKVAIESASGSTLSAQVGKYYRFDSAVTSLAVTLPTISNATTIQGCVFYLTTGSNISLTFTGGGTVKYHDGYEIKASSTYEINAIWNGAVWVIASIKIS